MIKIILKLKIKEIRHIHEIIYRTKFCELNLTVINSDPVNQFSGVIYNCCVNLNIIKLYDLSTN